MIPLKGLDEKLILHHAVRSEIYTLLIEVKALIPILLTEQGISIEVSFEQPENASLPMVVTLLGMVTDVRPLQL